MGVCVQTVPMRSFRIFRQQHDDVLVQVACGVSIGTEVLVFYQFYTMSRPSYSSTGALLDGGMDLNQPGGLTEYVPASLLYLSILLSLSSW